MAGIEIRRANPDESDSIQALVQKVADETFAHIFAPLRVPIVGHDWTQAWLAVSDAQIVGVVLTHDEWVGDLWVLRECRRHGIGQRLLAQAASEIAARGHKTLRLRVVKSNNAAVDFYLGQGWQVAREFPHEKFHHAMFEMTKDYG
jgi:ribosomal protein S18 acetylase RimI-like enzyme